jgi:hypothetical protein
VLTDHISPVETTRTDEPSGGYIDGVIPPVHEIQSPTQTQRHATETPIVLDEESVLIRVTDSLGWCVVDPHRIRDPVVVDDVEVSIALVLCLEVLARILHADLEVV